MPTLVQSLSPRSIVSAETAGLRILIPSKRSGAVLFLLIWICFWTVGGATAIRSLRQHFNFFLCSWLMGWALGELAVSYAILYMLAGREVILANSETLTCRTEIFGLGVGLARSYLVREMRNFRFQPAVGSARDARPAGLPSTMGPTL
jgi:hypothetical protein